MSVDKKIKYQDQRLTASEKKKIKPANQGGGPNYLGKQETVTVPKKWLSDPDHVVAELAYITPREQKILLDANIYGSLKGKPNKGPGGIMSLQGDLGGYSAGAGGTSSGQGAGDAGKGKGGRSTEDYKQSDYYKMMTGTGTTATSPTGDTVRSDNIAKGAVPEYVNTPDGVKYVGSKNKFVGKGLFNRDGYRSTVGTSPTFIDRLFGRKNPMGSIITRINPVTGQLEYYSEEEDVGEAKPGVLGRILGGIGSLVTGIPIVGSAIGTAYDYGKGIFSNQPKDMSQFNRYGLYGIPKGTLDFDPNAKINVTTPNINNLDSFDRFNINYNPKEIVDAETIVDAKLPTGTVYPSASSQGIMSQVATGTVYPGMSSLQQQFPVRSDFNIDKSRLYDELANPAGIDVPWQYSNLRL